MKPWAILYERSYTSNETEIVWAYGITGDEFPSVALNLVLALQELGLQLYGSGVATVEFPSSKPFHTEQLFIVNLSDVFLFLISDLRALVHLMPHISLPSLLEDQLKAVLIAHGSNIFASQNTKAKTREEEVEVVSMFRYVLSLLKRSDTHLMVDEQTFSLSPLTLPELLMFHLFLREHFNKFSLASDYWAIMAPVDGSQVDYQHHYLRDNVFLTTSLLSALTLYCDFVFGMFPSRVSFGSQEIQDITFIVSGRRFLALNNARKVVADPEFRESWLKLGSVKEVLQEDFVQFLKSQVSVLVEDRLPSDFASLTQMVQRLIQGGESIDIIRGVGPKTTEILAKQGISSLSELALLSDQQLKTLAKAEPSVLSVRKMKKWQGEANRLLRTRRSFHL